MFFTLKIAIQERNTVLKFVKITWRRLKRWFAKTGKKKKSGFSCSGLFQMEIPTKFKFHSMSRSWSNFHFITKGLFKYYVTGRGVKISMKKRDGKGTGRSPRKGQTSISSDKRASVGAKGRQYWQTSVSRANKYQYGQTSVGGGKRASVGANECQ